MRIALLIAMVILCAPAQAKCRKIITIPKEICGTAFDCFFVDKFCVRGKLRVRKESQ